MFPSRFSSIYLVVPPPFTVILPSLIAEAVVEYDMMYSVASDNSSHVTSTVECDNALALTLFGAGKPTQIKW